jgi:hypothetical protein
MCEITFFHFDKLSLMIMKNKSLFVPVSCCCYSVSEFIYKAGNIHYSVTLKNVRVFASWTPL